jgi:hypothetical protein
MSDPTRIFNEILNFLVNVFFAIPNGGGSSMYQQLATQTHFSISGNDCTLDKLDLTGVSTNPNVGYCTPCTKYNVPCYPFVGWMGNSTSCVGTGVIVTLGNLLGIAGLKISTDPGAISGQIGENGICTVVFNNCLIPEMIYSDGNYSVGACAVACGDCNRDWNQQCGYTPAVNVFSLLEPFKAPVYCSITFNLQLILSSTELGIDFSRSTILFNNMNIGFFPSWVVGVSPYTFDIGNYLNQQLGGFVESRIPITLLQSIPNQILPIGINFPYSVNNKLSMRQTIHKFATPFSYRRTQIPYLFINDVLPDGSRILRTNFNSNTSMVNIVKSNAPINEDDAKFFGKKDNIKSIKSIENFSYY